MNTKDRIVSLLEQFNAFFLAHNELNWARLSERAILATLKDDADFKNILYSFVGSGMGSLVDLYICSFNGHLIITTEEDANKQLSELREQLLTIKQGLGRL